MRLLDLSSPIDASLAWEPNPVRHEVLSPAQGARHMAEAMSANWGIEFDAAALPDEELLSLDTLTLTTHTGTHVDAPSHYGSRGPDGPPPHIDAVPLDWFLAPAVVLDATAEPVGALDADWVRRELDRVGHALAPRDIVVLHTGSDRYLGSKRYFTDFVGLAGSAVRFLLDGGVRVIGTDAFSLDAPFGHMIAEYHRGNDRDVLWPAHVAGRTTAYYQIERLAGLDRLPAPTGFRLCCFPVKVAGAGAGWARAVALLDED